MQDIIYGKNAVYEALKANRPINKLLITSKRSAVGDIISIARANGVPVQTVDRVYLDKLVGKPNIHQGLAAVCAAKEYINIDKLIDSINDNHFFVMLDEIQDPQNLGAIMRTADAAGAHGIIIPNRRSVALTSSVAKASAGAMEHVPVARVSNLSQTIDKLKRNNIWVIGADMQAKNLLWDVSFDGPIALVIGGEGKGLGRLIKEKCDMLVKLPMLGRVNSLNASVAAALLMYEVVRQRAGGK